MKETIRRMLIALCIMAVLILGFLGERAISMHFNIMYHGLTYDEVWMNVCTNPRMLVANIVFLALFLIVAVDYAYNNTFAFTSKEKS